VPEHTQLNIDVNLLTDDGLPKDDVNIPHSKLGASLFSDFAEGKDLRMRTLSALGEEQVSPVRLNASRIFVDRILLRSWRTRRRVIKVIKLYIIFVK
jgi:hypothetical protein